MPALPFLNRALLPCILALGTACAGSGKMRPGETISSLMKTLVDPSADEVWGAVGTVIDSEGTHEVAPRTPADWEAVRRAAFRIRAAAELLSVPGLRAAPPGEKSVAPGVELEPPQMDALIASKHAVFAGFALALREAADEAAASAEARSPARLLAAGSRMERVCEACHSTFWYPGEKVPSISALRSLRDRLAGRR